MYQALYLPLRILPLNPHSPPTIGIITLSQRGWRPAFSHTAPGLGLKTVLSFPQASACSHCLVLSAPGMTYDNKSLETPWICLLCMELKDIRSVKVPFSQLGSLFVLRGMFPFKRRDSYYKDFVGKLSEWSKNRCFGWSEHPFKSFEKKISFLFWEIMETLESDP